MIQARGDFVDIKIPEILNELIGYKCCEARVGYADSLVLGFGEKNCDDRGKIYNFDGEWELRTDSCTWRLNLQDNIIFGYYDEIEENDKILNMLLSLKLIKITQISSSDIMLTFENGYDVFLLAQSKDTDLFGIFAPQNRYIGFNPINKWYTKSSDEPAEGLSEEEKLFNQHTKMCCKRWESKIPQSADEGNCKDCAYYCPLRGVFYFWDYGICSNENSIYDGNLVECKSGCNQYSDNLNIEQKMF